MMIEKLCANVHREVYRFCQHIGDSISAAYYFINNDMN